MGFIGRPMMESMKLVAHEHETGWYWLDADEQRWFPRSVGEVTGGDAIEGAGGNAIEDAGVDVGTANTGGAGRATQPPPLSDLAFRVDRNEQMQHTLLSTMQWIMQVEIQDGGYDLPPLPFPVPPFQQQQEPVDPVDVMED
ncbi:hypothetical protein L1987_07301 [Smallanthus sonchifolius]|uniref:Uncharacterized protein n=1 Tax=Smallanthus sonchifolius TaxID=185202 RepID=A0ACB9K0B4_9ASTR|nr:hypothetical protein L1987_07301 [Smallanthus sonchifolius]